MIFSKLPKFLAALVGVTGILLSANIANSEDLPFTNGRYATDQKYCNYSDNQIANLGDRAGAIYINLGGGKIDNNYESFCTIEDVSVSGNKVTFKSVCSSEGEVDKYDNLYTMLSETSYENEGTTYSLCKPSFVSQLSAEQIMNIQTILVKLGYEPGTPDGEMGPNTNRAINAFRKLKGLQLAPELDQVTFDLLVKVGLNK